MQPAPSCIGQCTTTACPISGAFVRALRGDPSPPLTRLRGIARSDRATRKLAATGNGRRGDPLARSAPGTANFRASTSKNAESRDQRRCRPRSKRRHAPRCDVIEHLPGTRIRPYGKADQSIGAGDDTSPAIVLQELQLVVVNFHRHAVCRGCRLRLANDHAEAWVADHDGAALLPSSARQLVRGQWPPTSVPPA
jgi:hypothetical protein